MQIRPGPALTFSCSATTSRTEGAPVPVVTDSDPATLLEKVRAANRGGDVHLVGGPRTIETSSHPRSAPTRNSSSKRSAGFRRARSRSSTRALDR